MKMGYDKVEWRGDLKVFKQYGLNYKEDLLAFNITEVFKYNDTPEIMFKCNKQNLTKG